METSRDMCGTSVPVVGLLKGERSGEGMAGSAGSGLGGTPQTLDRRQPQKSAKTLSLWWLSWGHSGTEVDVVGGWVRLREEEGNKSEVVLFFRVSAVRRTFPTTGVSGRGNLSGWCYGLGGFRVTEEEWE